MWELIRQMARLSRPARLGLATAGGIAAAATGATLATGGPEPASRVASPVAAGPYAAESEGLPGADLEPGPTPIELEVEPEVLEWPDDHSVEISGTTAIDAEDPHVALTVVSPSGRSYRLERAAVARDGGFSAAFELHESEPDRAAPGGPPVARLELGTFQVTATSPGGFGSAAATFTVQRYQEITRREWVEPADRLARRGFDLVANLKTCLGNMPVSPAREDLRARVNELEAALQERLSSTPSLASLYAAVMTELEDMPDEAASLEELLDPLNDRLDEWGKEADRFEHRVRHDGMRCAGAPSCDRADLIAQDLDVLTELLALLRRPVELIGEYGRSDALQGAVREGTMLDLAFFQKKLDAAKATLESSGGLTAWFTSAQGRIEQTRALAQRELFQPYCRKFEGPFSLTMKARAWSKEGMDWWRYEIALDGQLTLRYPAAPGGRSVPLTGELTGCAGRFESWDDALRVGWPKLMTGAILFRTVKEPFQGTCPRFELPVRGELRGEAIVLTLEPAAREDYGEPSASVTYIVISPLAGGLPARTSFSLPYKSAHFIWNRALEGKPLELPVRRLGNQLVVAAELNATRGGERVEGVYEGTLKACNPGCASAGGATP